MYCTFCGKEISNDSAFCGFCGKQLVGQTLNNTNKNQNTAKKKKIKTILLASGIMMIATVLIVIGFTANVNKVKLKYDWGTPASEIEENEIVLGVFTFEYPNIGEEELRFACEDIYHEVDGIRELPFDEEVFYWTDFDGELYRISYYTDEDLSLTETLDILIKHYGENYYIDTYDRTDARFYHYYWWVDDTIIEYYNYGIDYYDAEVKYEHISSEMKEFFEKD